jgi:hypothetical protein
MALLSREVPWRFVARRTAVLHCSAFERTARRGSIVLFYPVGGSMANAALPMQCPAPAIWRSSVGGLGAVLNKKPEFPCIFLVGGRDPRDALGRHPPPRRPPLLAGAGLQLRSVREIAVERLIFDRSDQHISNQPWSYTPKQLSSAPLRHMGGRWWLILGHLLAILRTSAVYSALRPSFISVNQIRWPPNFVSLLSEAI